MAIHVQGADNIKNRKRLYKEIGRFIMRHRDKFVIDVQRKPNQQIKHITIYSKNAHVPADNRASSSAGSVPEKHRTNDTSQSTGSPVKHAISSVDRAGDIINVMNGV